MITDWGEVGFELYEEEEGLLLSTPLLRSYDFLVQLGSSRLQIGTVLLPSCFHFLSKTQLMATMCRHAAFALVLIVGVGMYQNHGCSFFFFKFLRSDAVKFC